MRQGAKVVYFVHLVISAIFTTYILAVHPSVIAPTITFAMLLIYGFMMVWVLLINFAFIVPPN